MIPPQFDYVRADDLDAAIGALVEHGEDAKLLAGGHSLLPLMKLRLAEPAVLVDIERIDGLDYVRTDGDEVTIGAMTRIRTLERSELLAEAVPLLSTAAGHVGDSQVRNRGTIGGSLAHGDGASDLPAVVLALGGTLVATGPAGQRRIAADDFFEGFLETALEPDEVLTEVRVPRAPGANSFQKFHRRAQDWAVVGVAAARVEGRVGIGLVNMASVPLRATAVEDALAGGASVAEAAALAADGTEAPNDFHGSAEYREHLARVLVARALDELGTG